MSLRALEAVLSWIITDPFPGLGITSTELAKTGSRMDNMFAHTMLKFRFDVVVLLLLSLCKRCINPHYFVVHEHVVSLGTTVSMSIYMKDAFNIFIRIHVITIQPTTSSCLPNNGSYALIFRSAL